MRVMKWSMIALAVSAGTSQFAMASAQDDSKGFVEDSTFSINTRALYFSRDFRNNDSGKSRVEETGLGFLGTFESGFTQGTVGFGIDAIGLLGVRLDSAANQTRGPRISSEDSVVNAWVIPTNEELMIARHVRRVLKGN